MLPGSGDQHTAAPGALPHLSRSQPGVRLAVAVLALRSEALAAVVVLAPRSRAPAAVTSYFLSTLASAARQTTTAASAPSVHPALLLPLGAPLRRAAPQRAPSAASTVLDIFVLDPALARHELAPCHYPDLLLQFTNPCDTQTRKFVLELQFYQMK